MHKKHPAERVSSFNVRDSMEIAMKNAPSKEGLNANISITNIVSPPVELSEICVKNSCKTNAPNNRSHASMPFFDDSAKASHFSQDTEASPGSQKTPASGDDPNLALETLPATSFSGVMWFSFLIQGIANLTGWNVFLTCLGYIFPYDDDMKGVVRANKISIPFYTALCFVFSCLFTFLSGNINAYYKSFLSDALNIVVLAGFSLFSWIAFFSDSEGGTFAVRTEVWYLVFCALFLALLAFGNAAGNNGFFLLLSKLPNAPSFMSAFFNGQGVSGFLISLIGFCIYHSVGDGKNLKKSINFTAICFTVMTVFPVLAFFLLVVYFRYSSFYKHFEAERRRDLAQRTIVSPVAADSPQSAARLSANNSTLFSLAFQKAMAYMYSVFMVFFVTLVILSDLTVKRFSSGTKTNSLSKYFVDEEFCLVVALLLMYNLGDCLGRFIPTAKRFDIKAPRKLVAWSTGRLLFIVYLYALKSLAGKVTGVVYEILFSDSVIMLVYLALGLTNGYIGTCSMIHGADGTTGKLANTINALMPLSLIFGIAFGSLIGALIK